mmetsp:Transcript_58744/g.143701  ORF Transcript_58744/g.143701 Transcript_58744/m.143701 type:complete len:615 (+) Transcript_58744:133-1977(+)|eukprot:CAMPEP_0113468936 /NCGR_PEP_ID=MMETSP0014_2-20120614/15625_1 /TAXON_ID=2857 /ORGANISM="Nitzschia sp." /LENGTH=614 /DNA_ID=CAMNT_0000361367 /DNA_START=55 /DNA_END=1899 /DNA_ORIENTATION=- /assembly_acc=CAM_ASM_000159
MARLTSVLYRGQVKFVAQVFFSSEQEEEEEGGRKNDISAVPSFFFCDLSSIARNICEYFELKNRDDSEGMDSQVQKLIELSSQPESTLHIAASQCQMLAPISSHDCKKFLCIGMNYRDHCSEQNVAIPTEPVVFGKFPSTCIMGPDQPLVLHPEAISTKVDYEVELGIVIGKQVPRFTSKAEARLYIGGYTVVHDVSARDWQLERNGGQWLVGKSIDGYAPIGPVVETGMTFDEAHSSNITCRVNGETLQNSSTQQLVFQADDIIEHISKFMTLEVGDIIATGTPPGVGCFRTPQRWLKPGDIVECEIEGIGILRTPVVVPDASPASSSSEEGNITDPSSSTTASGTLPQATTLPNTPYPYGRLGGMTCIVTGGGRGIGYGIAHKLAMEGATRIGIVDLTLEATQDACQRLKKENASCDFVPMPCDVTNESAVQTAFKTFADQNGGRIDVLVQAAGIVGKTNILTDQVENDNFDLVYDVNVKGILNGCKVVLPIMKRNEYGRIVNIASIAGKDGNAGMLAYSTSKAAVIGLTKTIGKEYATSGITCNALAPAVVRTQMVDEMPPEQVKYMTDKIPMKRCGSIEEIAALVAFMSSSECSFTTGFCFDATGGRSVY